MNYIIWNCREGNGVNFRRNFQSLLDWHKPPLVALETKMQDHQSLLDEFNFNNMIQVLARGNWGGIVLLWEDSQLEVDEIMITNQEIHAIIKVYITNFSWLMSCVYASVHVSERLKLWENLKSIKANYQNQMAHGGRTLTTFKQSLETWGSSNKQTKDQ